MRDTRRYERVAFGLLAAATYIIIAPVAVILVIVLWNGLPG
jgi:hypothetical protein